MTNAQGRPVPILLATATPLAVVAAAYGLWLISDRAVHVGPLDRATFGWVVVLPLWLLAPYAGGLAWRGLATRSVALAATMFGLIVGLAAAFLFWGAVAHPACETGAVWSPAEWALPSLAVGAMLGGGLVISAAMAMKELRSGRRFRGLWLSVGLELILGIAAVFTTTVIVVSGACQRP